MKPHLPLIAVGFFLATLSAESYSATRPRELARSQTANIIVSGVEMLEQYGSAAEYSGANTEALAKEIKSCGITYNGTNCLDTQFENFGNAGVKDVDTKDKSGYIFFSRFKMKNDKRILLMAVIANKSDCKLTADKTKCAIDPVTKKPVPEAAFRTANIWAIDAGREKPESYIADFLNCVESEGSCLLRPLLAYDPIRGTAEDNALSDLEGTKAVFANDFRRFYSAAVSASTFAKQPNIDRAVRALTARSEVITKSGNAIYRAAFMNLMKTKFTKNPDLIKDVAREVVATAAAGSSEKIEAALLLAKGGESSKDIVDTLTAAYANTRLSLDLRKDAVLTLSKIASSAAEKDKIVALLGSADQVLRSASYTAMGSIALTEENLPTITKLLSNSAVNIRGNAVRALSRVPGETATFQMATIIRDRDIDVALTAAQFVKADIEAMSSISEVQFKLLLEGTTLAVVPSIPRDRKVLKDDLVPLRAEILVTAFGKVNSSQISMLANLQTSVASKVATVRVEAVFFINKLSINEATMALIDLLVHADLSVAAEAKDSLSQRLLTDRQLDQLFKIAQAKSVSARRNAVALIGKISSKKALQALLQKSAENIDSSSHLVRADVANILGTIYVEEATSRLIVMINDASVDVRTAALNQIAKGDRLLDDKQIATLKSLLQSSYADVPASVIKLLAKINSSASLNVLASLSGVTITASQQILAVKALATIDSPEAVNAMIGFIALENGNVRGVAEAILNTKILTEDQIARIGTSLAHTAPEVRSSAIRLLNRAGSAVALKLLQDQAKIEADANVKAMLDATIAALTGATQV